MLRWIDGENEANGETITNAIFSLTDPSWTKQSLHYDARLVTFEVPSLP